MFLLIINIYQAAKTKQNKKVGLYYKPSIQKVKELH